MKCNLEYYRTFFMTANLLNFTKAAEQLYVTQSAVSQTIKKLEAELGCSLFLRSSSGLKLTKEGEILCAHVKKAFEELQKGEYELMKAGSFQAGELRIGATETALRFFLAPFIHKFREAFPDIHITFAGSTTRDTCERLAGGSIELAFLISPVPREYRFELTEIHTLQDIFFANNAFPVDVSREYTPREIAKYPLVSISPENSVRGYLDQWFLKHGIIFAPEYTVRSTGLVLPLVQNNLGIGILPEEYVSGELRRGSLMKIRMTDLPPARQVYIGTNPHAPVSAIGGMFYHFVLENLSLT